MPGCMCSGSRHAPPCVPQICSAVTITSLHAIYTPEYREVRCLDHQVLHRVQHLSVKDNEIHHLGNVMILPQLQGSLTNAGVCLVEGEKRYSLGERTHAL